MTTSLGTLALGLLIAPAITWLPDTQPRCARSCADTEVAAQQASVDPCLGAMRAGSSTEVPLPFDELERAVLAANHQQPDTDLAALRAGDGPEGSEWGWLAVGAGVVLLIFLI